MRGVLHPSFTQKHSRICKECGAIFMASPNRDYCDKCRELTCKRCGKKFLPKQGSHKQQCCSFRCGLRIGRTKITVTLPKARNAQRLIKYYIDKGKIVRPRHCEECGQEKRIEAAHYNYSEPLRVRWLCRSCHVKWDKQNPKHGTYANFIGQGDKWEEITAKITDK